MSDIQLFLDIIIPVIYHYDKRVERAKELAKFFVEDGRFNGIKGRDDLVYFFTMEQPIRGICTRMGAIEGDRYECVMYKGIGDVEVVTFGLIKGGGAGGARFEWVETTPAGYAEIFVSSIAGGGLDIIKYVSTLY